jgi:ElaA protein
MLTWTCQPFDALTVTQLYSILQLRNAVFVVEQNCPYQDADDKDPHCLHLCGWQDQHLVAYARLVPKGISYNTHISIGRVVTCQAVRGTGAGKALIQQAIQHCYAAYGQQAIKISAQLYLQRFYTSFGFEQVTPVYLEDNIEHIGMIKA